MILQMIKKDTICLKKYEQFKFGFMLTLSNVLYILNLCVMYNTFFGTSEDILAVVRLSLVSGIPHT